MGDIVEVDFSTKGLAEAALKSLKTMAERNVVTFQDFCEVVGSPSDYDADKEEGWTSFEGSTIIKNDVGWSLRLPDPGPIT